MHLIPMIALALAFPLSAKAIEIVEDGLVINIAPNNNTISAMIPKGTTLSSRIQAPSELTAIANSGSTLSAKIDSPADELSVPLDLPAPVPLPAPAPLPLPSLAPRVDPPAPEPTPANRVATALEANKTVRFSEITFEYDKAVLDDEAYAFIQIIGDALNASPALKVVIEGHTDDTGTPQYNKRLSQDRAEAVRQALISRLGILPDRMRAVGYGEASPFADNSTPEGRAQNRRVEVIKQP